MAMELDADAGAVDAGAPNGSGAGGSGDRLYVSGLSNQVTERELDAVFSRFGSVIDIALKNGYAFVGFDDRRSAQAALTAMHDTVLDGIRLRVEFSKAARKRTPADAVDGGTSERCFSCGKTGHWLKDCPEADERDRSRCFNCNEPGHLARNCPHPFDKDRPNAKRGGIGKKHTERDRDRDKDRDRDRDRERDRPRGAGARGMDRGLDRGLDRPIDRPIDRGMDRGRDRDRGLRERERSPRRGDFDRDRDRDRAPAPPLGRDVYDAGAGAAGFREPRDRRDSLGPRDRGTDRGRDRGLDRDFRGGRDRLDDRVRDVGYGAGGRDSFRDFHGESRTGDAYGRGNGLRDRDLTPGRDAVRRDRDRIDDRRDRDRDRGFGSAAGAPYGSGPALDRGFNGRGGYDEPYGGAAGAGRGGGRYPSPIPAPGFGFDDRRGAAGSGGRRGRSPPPYAGAAGVGPNGSYRRERSPRPERERSPYRAAGDRDRDRGAMHRDRLPPRRRSPGARSRSPPRRGGGRPDAVPPARRY